MKKLLSLFFAALLTLGVGVGCKDKNTSDTSSSNSEIEFEAVDYAASVTLDMNSDTKKEEATVKLFIDGDTTHFNVSDKTPGTHNGVLKARYLAINTPESTGKIEEWGKAASKFTRSKLESATSIMLETDGDKWELDSTGERHLVWVWYKTACSDTYRNLNIEILQNGYAIASNSEGNRYGEVCGKAIAQAQTMKLHVYSKDTDPDFYYGSAIPMDLKHLRLNIEEYNGSKVAFDGVVSYLNDGGAYIEDFDEETNVWYGMYIYYGFSLNPFALEFLKPGNKLRIVGTVSYWEAGGSYQVSGLEFNMRNPDDMNSTNLIDEEKHALANVETSLDTFFSKVNVNVIDETTEEITSKEYDYAALALHSSISMKGLRVKKVHTTDNGGDNDGALSITCEYGGKEIVVRTIVMKDTNGNIVTADVFTNKTIDVKGIIDYYQPENSDKGSYQVKVFNYDSITIH